MSKKIFLLIAVIGVVVLFALGLFSGRLVAKQSSPATPTRTTNQPTLQSFSFQYPPDWSLTTQTVNITISLK